MILFALASVAAQQCAPGRHAVASGGCTDCEPGRYSHLPGQAECTPCETGRYSAVNATGGVSWTETASIDSSVIGNNPWSVDTEFGSNVAMNANPIGLIVLGIAAVIAIIVVMVKYWDNIKAAIAKFAAWIAKNNPFEWMVTLIDKVFPGFREKIEKLKEWVKNLLLGVWESIKKVW